MSSPTSSISGLASGLDTSSIISQLMALEAQPQNNLKTELSAEQSTVKTLQSLNAKVAALATQAKTLASPTTWQTLVATSSSAAVRVATTTGATAGSFDFHVDQTATAHQLSFTNSAAGTDVVVGAGTTVTLTQNGTTTTLDTKTGTLDGLVNALNASGTGVSAAKIKLDDGTYRLRVTATQTGAASAFTLTDSSGGSLLGGATVTAGQDAAITVGSDTLHSATNEFSSVLPGLDLTVSAAAAGTDVTVGVAQNSSTVQSSVKSFVDAVNATLAQIDSLTAYDATNKTPGPLVGDSTAVSLRDKLLNAIYPSDGTSMASVGLQSDRYGNLVFDQTAFATAYAADPAGTAAKFTSSTTNPGFGARIATVATEASDPISGTITSSITNWNTSINRVTADIADWDTRLALRQTSLQQQFTALETAMSQMNSQSSWLAGQIASLPTTSSGK